MKTRILNLFIRMFWSEVPEKVPPRVRFAYKEGHGEWVEADARNVSNLRELIFHWNNVFRENTHWLEYEP